MSTEVSAIEAVIQNYFDGLYDGDIPKLESIFDASCVWYERVGNEVSAVTVAEKMNGLAQRASPRSQGLAREDRIVAIEIVGSEMAFVRLNVQIPPKYFTDFMTMIKLPGAGWKIVTKTFYADIRE